jgi:hypothetical protein
MGSSCQMLERESRSFSSTNPEVGTSRASQTVTNGYLILQSSQYYHIMNIKYQARIYISVINRPVATRTGITLL